MFRPRTARRVAIGALVPAHVDLVIVLAVHQRTQSDLLQIAGTACHPGFFPGPREYWEQNGGQDRDNVAAEKG